ncbi:MAG: Lrp/AsnC family transcriptional regulator [Methylobacterium sp.]|nr:Lrp/AsnC family transcriptional regulator [Methylobacterium sp.]MCA3599106.1 Lrp/AsnC family transcriptional regulator [Methylobacterium sp.]MCA3603479.1 Lrp/AsnC family transcriptional regulator [Methylobacterium sp.]MCA3605768.1 Lrp/AsnC family transcriptional regulator [Methylobacterium sp.]MCA3608410.1 Lrp/AsnC family transcriptional regulator [Methylobacterium sp.]
MHKSCMDHFDIKLLDALQRDGRLTNNELAEKVGLSPSQCSRRRSQLEEEGAIRGYHAALEPGALGFGVIAFVQVTLATHSPDNARRFQQLVERVDEVQEAFAVTGEADYLVKMVAPDLPSLATLLNDIFLPHESVAHVRSSIALTTLKDSRLLPVSRKAPHR